MDPKETQSVRTDNIATVELRPCSMGSVTILDVLGVDLCARAILDRVPLTDLVRSERVSRRWQRVVRAYLQTCSLSYCDSMDIFLYSKNDYKHRGIVIPYLDRQPLIHKTLDKWGSCIVKVIIDIDCYDYIYTVASTCPYLWHVQFNYDRPFSIAENVFESEHHDPPRTLYVELGADKNLENDTHNNYINCKELKHLSLNAFPRMFDDDSFVKIFNNLDCEKLEISHNTGLSGTFLNSFKLNNLKSLTLDRCFALHTSKLCSNGHKLRNLTTLKLNHIDKSIFKNIHILLKSTPKLEELSLCNYAPTELSDEVIASFARLDLRRVNLVRNASVSSALLQAIAQGSSSLERADLTGLRAGCGRGVAALCRRPLVTLLLGYIRKDMTDFNQCRHDFQNHIKTIPVISELKALGCVEFTKQWWEDTWHASQGRDHPLELTIRHTGVESQRELKIILADNFIDQRPMMF